MQGPLHTGFSLSSTNGESLLITAPDGITVVDQVDFGPQATGVSYGRASDGASEWVVFSTPTPGASNNAVGIAERTQYASRQVWPNPVQFQLHIDRPFTGTLFDAQGRELAHFDRVDVIQVDHLEPGSYLLRDTDGSTARFTKW